MSAVAATILEDLQRVTAERRRRAGDPPWNARVQAIKDYQQRRFALTYTDLLAHARYGPAARFFLTELYGPADFSQRDAQFERVVPALARLFPQEMIATVATLTHLHMLSESLDSEMGRQLPADATVTALAYLDAWRRTGREADRVRQIDLIVEVGKALDRYTRNPWLRHTLRVMRAPAKAAGLSAMQQFLELGFDTFRAIGGANTFLSLIESRERSLAASLFDRQATIDGVGRIQIEGASLGQLP